MPPVGDEYSSISQADFDLLVTSEITPQIAGQWLYNVKQFTRTVMEPIFPVPTPPAPTEAPVTYYYTALTGFAFPPQERINHKKDPQLRFYEPDEPQQHLKVSIQNGVYYAESDDPSNPITAYIDSYLYSYCFVKKEDKWYVGSQLASAITATMYELTSTQTIGAETNTITSVITQKFYP